MLLLARLVPALLWMGLIYRSSATPGLRSLPLVQRLGLLPPDLSPEVAWWLEMLLRKSAHMLAYAILAVLLAWALSARLPRRTALWAALVAALLYAVTDEVHQAFVPMREGRLLDVVIDGVGAALGLLLLRPRTPGAASAPDGQGLNQ